MRADAQQLNNGGRHRQAGVSYRRLLRELDQLDLRETLTRSPADRATPGGANHPDADPPLGHPPLGHPPDADPQRRELRVRAWMGLAFAQLATAHPVAGLAALDEAQRVAGTDPTLRALVHRQRGVLLANVGRVRESLDQFDLAARDRDALGEYDVILVLMNRALAHAHLGHARAAAADSGELLALVDPQRYPVEHFMATYNAGMIAYLAGDLPGALATMARADALDVDVTRAPGRVDECTVLLDAGLVRDAIRVADAILPECAELGQRLFLAQLHTIRSRAYLLLEQPDSAYAAARAALDALSVGSARQPKDAARLMVLAARLARGDPPRPIARAADRLVARTVRDASSSAPSARLLAAQAWLLVDPARAEAAIARLRPGSIVSLSDRLRVRHVQAAGALARGDKRRARRILNTSAADLRRSQRMIASVDIATARALHTIPLVIMDIELALRSGPGSVYATTERWRAATAPLAVVRPPADTQTAALVARLRAEHAQLESAPPGPAARTRIRELEREIRMRDWGARAVHAPVAPHPAPSYREARAQLAQRGLAAVSYLTHQDTIHALVLGDGPPRVIAGMRATRASELVRRVRADLRVRTMSAAGRNHRAVGGALRAELAELQAGLLTGLGLSGRPLAVIPTRTITGLPWGLLPDLVGRPVVVAGSITEAVAPAPERPPIPVVDILTGPGLRSGAAEAGAVAAAWRDRAAARVTPRATGRDLRAALRDSTLVHISAHGRHEESSPLFSRLDLTDGPLFAHELQDSGVGASHVVLAACEIGGSSTGPGEGSVGFAHTLLGLGVAAVVAAVAPVPDGVAAELVGHLHRHLADGATADDALALAVSASDPSAGVFSVFGRRC